MLVLFLLLGLDSGISLFPDWKDKAYCLWARFNNKCHRKPRCFTQQSQGWYQHNTSQCSHSMKQSFCTVFWEGMRIWSRLCSPGGKRLRQDCPALEMVRVWMNVRGTRSSEPDLLHVDLLLHCVNQIRVLLWGPPLKFRMLLFLLL